MLSYWAIVDRLVQTSDGAYERHVEAAKRLTKDIDPHLFMRYCLRPAIKMRAIIQRQLEILDPDEYRKPTKQMPQFTLREIQNEEN